MYKSILIPVDLAHTEKGKQAIEVAREVSGADTKVRLISVVEDVPAFIASQIPDGVMDKIRADAGNALRALADTANVVSKVESEVRTGHPRTTILTAAEECDADLIIVGSHQPGVQDLLLGSTASHVVQHAKCSVLVVR